MATVKELEEQLRTLQQTLEAHGIRQPAPAATRPEDRADYFAHGSDKHAAFLGLVPAEPGDGDHITYTSPRTGRTFRLEDEITQFMTYHDPEKAAQLTLQQKVNELEIEPEVPEDARPIWRPIDVPA